MDEDEDIIDDAQPSNEPLETDIDARIEGDLQTFGELSQVSQEEHQAKMPEVEIPQLDTASIDTDAGEAVAAEKTRQKTVRREQQPKPKRTAGEKIREDMRTFNDLSLVSAGEALPQEEDSKLGTMDRARFNSVVQKNRSSQGPDDASAGQVFEALVMATNAQADLSRNFAALLLQHSMELREIQHYLERRRD